MKLVDNIMRNSKLMEFIRFCIVGVIAAAIHYGIYLLLLWIMNIDFDAARGVDWRTNMAYSLGYVISLICNLYLTAHFTFRAKLTVKRSGGFVLSHVVNYAIHILLLNVYLWLGIAEWIAPALVLLVAVPVNFILVRTVFKNL